MGKKTAEEVLGKLKVEPWGQNILIKQDAAPKEAKQGSIVLPGKDTPPNIGTVVAIGAGRKHGNGFREPMCIQVGWRVYFQPYSGQKIEIDGEEYHVLDENAVLAIVTA
jgi:chaperonin GroES